MVSTTVVVAVLLSACGGGDSGAASTTVATERHKITVAGDSISVGLGSELREVVADADDGDVAVVKVIGQGGTGLARPDSYDWPSRLAALAKDFPPDVLVFSVGSNDAQDLTDVSGEVVAAMADEDAWDVEYSRRLAEVFDAFEHTGTRVVWVGQLRPEKQSVGDTNRHVHELATTVAADRPWVHVEDLAALLHTGDRVATSCLVADGLHLTVECYRRADEAMLHRLLAS